MKPMMKKKIVRSRTSSAPEKETLESRERILDAAERLFAELTFDAVSMRDISAAAGVNLSLVQYHFRTKASLFEEVIARRADALCERRRTLLAKIQAQPRVAVEDILDGYVRPLFELTIGSSEEARSYALLLSQIGTSNRWVKLLEKYFDDPLRLFIVELRKALPQMPDERLFLGLNFAMSAALSAVARNLRLDRLSGGKLSASDQETVYPHLICFMAAGLRGLQNYKREHPLRASGARSHHRRQGRPC